MGHAISFEGMRKGGGRRERGGVLVAGSCWRRWKWRLH